MTGEIEAVSPGGNRILSGTIIAGVSVSQVGPFLDDLFASPELITVLPVIVTLLEDGETLEITYDDYVKMSEDEQDRWRKERTL